ncbi:MAG: DHH family phosphoesterase [Deltaproteobacteria bacterium]|nr:DHH family phosphoesterase [Deltaproteobacteria bacterium]
MTSCEKLREVIRQGRRLVVFLHDHPDPDALAAGWLLQRIGEKLEVPSRIVYGGQIGRAENETMVRLLRIPARPLREKMRFFKSDRYAVVDTQPGSGNNLFPHKRMRCHIVIDHHPRRSAFEADFVEVQPEQGSTTTMLLELFQQFGFELDADLATAVAYAIISETQDLGRETTASDRRALHSVLPLVRLQVLGRIRHPVHDREYYRTVARAMREVLVAKNTCVCHIGEVHQPGMAAELADFLIPMERVTWCLVTGYYLGTMVVSIRTTHEKAHSDRIISSILRGLGKGGGHHMIAGGAVPCASLDDYRQKAEQITDRFLKRLSRRAPERLHPLLQ